MKRLPLPHSAFSLLTVARLLVLLAIVLLSSLVCVPSHSYSHQPGGTTAPINLLTGQERPRPTGWMRFRRWLVPAGCLEVRLYPIYGPYCRARLRLAL